MCLVLQKSTRCGASLKQTAPCKLRQATVQQALELASHDLVHARPAPRSALSTGMQTGALFQSAAYVPAFTTPNQAVLYNARHP